MNDYTTSCEQFAREAAEVLCQWRGRFHVREKGRADLVTEADLASQRLIEQRVAAKYPTHRFVGEEGKSVDLGTNSSDFCWFVDPLDGTTNYVHGLTGWCVSIGVTQYGRPIAGCVFDPIGENCFTANRGGGAYLNGERIQTSTTESLGDSLVALSLPAEVSEKSPEIQCFLELLPKIRAFRRLGSAALNLCYVGSGQLDAYWAGSVHPWDVAAGMLVVEEAGGVVTTLAGESFELRKGSLAAAANVPLHADLIAELRRGSR